MNEGGEEGVLGFLHLQLLHPPASLKEEYLAKIGDRNGDGIPHDCYLLSEDRQDTIVESLVSPEPDDSTLLQ